MFRAIRVAQMTLCCETNNSITEKHFFVNILLDSLQ